jgi:S-ribosylhomocysteine lyase LuxS involved in autoinducer biosynthesis
MYQMELIAAAITEFVEESIHKIIEWSLLGCQMDYFLCILIFCTNQEQGTHQLDHTHTMGQCPS